MKKKPQWIKDVKKHAETVKDASSSSLKNIGSKLKEQADEIDKKYNVSEHASSLKKSAGEKLRDIDDRYEVSDKAKAGVKAVGKAAKDVKDHADKSGLTEKVVHAGNAIDENIIKPAVKLAEETGVTKQIGKISEATVEQYGKTRAWIKPYFAPETPDELLLTTKRELIYINACILQISRDEAEQLANRLGAAMVAKVAGVVSVGTLLGMVSTFGTASTGTAIAGLHGAAETNATLS